MKQKVTFASIINVWLQFYLIDFPPTATPEKICTDNR